MSGIERFSEKIQECLKPNQKESELSTIKRKCLALELYRGDAPCLTTKCGSAL